MLAAVFDRRIHAEWEFNLADIIVRPESIGSDEPTTEHITEPVTDLRGNEQMAVQCYLHACAKEPSYVHRGNLDPEISALIKAFALNARKDDDYSF